MVVGVPLDKPVIGNQYVLFRRQATSAYSQYGRQYLLTKKEDDVYYFEARPFPMRGFSSILKLTETDLRTKWRVTPK